MENNSLAKYCRPIEFEEVLSKHLSFSCRLAVGSGNGGVAFKI